MPVASTSASINSVGSIRKLQKPFLKLSEYAHFHYETSVIGTLTVEFERTDADENFPHPVWNEREALYCIRVTSNKTSWFLRRTYRDFVQFDKQLHRCVFDRRYSHLPELPDETILKEMANQHIHGTLKDYMKRLSDIAGSLITCAPVLKWLELDNHGNRLLDVADDSCMNVPAIAAAQVVKPYSAQAGDELNLAVGEIVSITDMPLSTESVWWRGKKEIKGDARRPSASTEESLEKEKSRGFAGFQVGFFPSNCVEIIGGSRKILPITEISNESMKPVFEKRGKLIALFRTFVASRKTTADRRRLKEAGILRERVFGCDLAEYLQNTGQEVPMVMKSCCRVIESHGITAGIYRLSGIVSNIQKLRNAFDENREPNLLHESILHDIHCIASCLKMYFRELPNPLFTYQLYHKFAEAVQGDDSSLKILRLHDVVQQLPPPHYRTAEFLLRHLTRVAEQGSKTGMDFRNLAIVWAPNLLRCKELENVRENSGAILQSVNLQGYITEYLIRYVDIIFNHKFPVFGGLAGCTATGKRKNRPRSMAVSSPAKLINLEEAQAKLMAARHDKIPPGIGLPDLTGRKCIDVNGGPAALPPLYHTVIDLPPGRRRRPGGFRVLFGGFRQGSEKKEGKSEVDGVAKLSMYNRRSGSGMSGSSFEEYRPTHSNRSHSLSGMEPRGMRPVRSAESLIPLSLQRLSQTIDEMTESQISTDLNSLSRKDTKSEHSAETVELDSPELRPHLRTLSVPSWFNRPDTLNVQPTYDSSPYLRGAVSPPASYDGHSTRLPLLETDIDEEYRRRQSAPATRFQLDVTADVSWQPESPIFLRQNEKVSSSDIGGATELRQIGTEKFDWSGDIELERPKSDMQQYYHTKEETPAQSGRNSTKSNKVDGPMSTSLGVPVLLSRTYHSVPNVPSAALDSEVIMVSDEDEEAAVTPSVSLDNIATVAGKPNLPREEFVPSRLQAARHIPSPLYPSTRLSINTDQNCPATGQSETSPRLLNMSGSSLLSAGSSQAELQSPLVTLCYVFDNEADLLEELRRQESPGSLNQSGEQLQQLKSLFPNLEMRRVEEVRRSVSHVTHETVEKLSREADRNSLVVVNRPIGSLEEEQLEEVPPPKVDESEIIQAVNEILSVEEEMGKAAGRSRSYSSFAEANEIWDQLYLDLGEDLTADKPPTAQLYRGSLGGSGNRRTLVKQASMYENTRATPPVRPSQSADVPSNKDFPQMKPIPDEVVVSRMDSRRTSERLSRLDEIHSQLLSVSNSSRLNLTDESTALNSEDQCEKPIPSEPVTSPPVLTSKYEVKLRSPEKFRRTPSNRVCHFRSEVQDKENQFDADDSDDASAQSSSSRASGKRIASAIAVFERQCSLNDPKTMPSVRNKRQMSAESSSSTTSTSERSENFVTVREVKKTNSMEKSTGESTSSDEMKSSALLSSVCSSDSFNRLEWCAPSRSGPEQTAKTSDRGVELLKESLLFRKQLAHHSSPIKRVASEVQKGNSSDRQIEYLSDYEYFNPSGRNLRSNSEPPNGQPFSLNLRGERGGETSVEPQARRHPFLPSTTDPSATGVAAKTTFVRRSDGKPQGVKQVYYV